jgi:hypothetical protein
MAKKVCRCRPGSLGFSPRPWGMSHRIECRDYSDGEALLRYKGSVRLRGQDYSDKPPSSTDKPVSGHPALRVGTQPRDGESLPSGLLVRQTFPGGAVHFDNLKRSVYVTDNRSVAAAAQGYRRLER